MEGLIKGSSCQSCSPSEALCQARGLNRDELVKRTWGYRGKVIGVVRRDAWLCLLRKIICGYRA